MGRHRPPSALLLVLAAAGVTSQNAVSLGRQRSSDCRLPLQLNLQDYQVGSHFSAECSPVCINTSLTSQATGWNTVFGTRIYDLDSDLCLAAVHDARLPHPSRLTGPTVVRLELVRHDGPFVGSFRRGVNSAGRQNQDHQRGLQFVSDKVQEDVPDITTVHTNFRRGRTGYAYVRCYVGSSDLLPDVQLYRVPAGTPTVVETKPNDGFASMTHYRRREDPPDVFLCRLKTSLYSDVTTFAYSGEPYYEPGQKTYRGNTGDNVTMTSSSKYGTWFGLGFSGLPARGGFATTRNLVIRNAREEHTGMYLLAYDYKYRPFSSATRLIIRACPADTFGTRCDKRCPRCLHGGQCHEATGHCVCPPGFVGSQCETGCGEARFGASCSAECPTTSQGSINCGGRLLCVPDPYGCSCAPGWSGNNCNQGCSQGRYGPDCAFRCGHCIYDSCNRFTGLCDSGCSREDVTTPLCSESEWPWFRDPPTVVATGFTTVSVTHRRWRREYDNGFSDGTLQYIGQVRPADRSAPWSTPQNSGAMVRDDRLPPGNENFQLDFSDLKAGTKYLVRIIIRDLKLRAQQESEDFILDKQISTNCAVPDAVGGIVIQALESRSVTVIFEDVANRKVACPFRLNVTVTGNSPGSTGATRRLVEPSAGRTPFQFAGLSPYSDYTVTVFAINREGSSPLRSETFRTHEAAPSRVTDLKYTRPGQSTFYITSWGRPAKPNGVIRYYGVHIKHLRFSACTAQSLNDDVDVKLLNTTDRLLRVSLKHDFSMYEVTVAAFTVTSGEKTSVTIPTHRSAPKSMVEVSATADVSSALLRWSWPACSTWGDDRRSLRLHVTIQGTEDWNRAYQRQRNLTTPPQRISDLTPYSSYSFGVRFCNSAGCYPSHKYLNVQTLESAPGPPQNVAAVAVTPTSVTIGWEPPRPPLSRIAQYRVNWGYSAGKNVILAVDDACSADDSVRPSCRAKVVDLREHTQYSFTVFALNFEAQMGDPSVPVVRKTGEAAPGPPRDLSFTSRSETMLNISWLEPEERNGRLRGFLLNVSLAEQGSERRRREAASLRSFQIAARQRSGRQLDDDMPYSQPVDSLLPGRRYLVTVAASTSAGFGQPATAFIHTLVSAPVIRGRPSVQSADTTDSTVLLVLPPAENSGGPVSSYLVVVSTDSNFNGSQLHELQLHEVPNAEESGEEGLGYYISASLGTERVARDNTFVVGDGRYYNSTERAYLNRPLTTGATYRLGVAALSRISEDNQRLTFTPIAAPVVVMRPAAPPLLPILMVFLALLLIVTALVAIYYRKRIEKAVFRNDAQHGTGVSFSAMRAKERDDEEVDIEDEDMTDDEEAVYANIQPDQIDYTRIALKDLAERARLGTVSGELKAQLQNLPHGLKKPCTLGELAQNKRKNRYINLLPYDESRVVLDKIPGDDFSDYINANYIEGYNRPRAYIACQGPKRDTVADFWRMVWQEKVTRIVMLTNLIESGKRKCDQYWPDADPVRLPGLTVLSDTEHVFSDYTVRKLSIRKGAETREVTHLHYTVWPDHGVPMHPSSLAKFIKTLNGISDGGAPTVVHCSAGVGRTGTVILIDSMYQMGLREQAVDVCSHLAVIRQQRANLCANLAQYQLVHQVLVELLVSPSAAVPAAQVASRVAQLRQPDADGRSQLQLQLRYLDEHRPTASYASLRGLQLDGKNRSPQVLPEDASRVFLDPTMPDNYINAVYVQGYTMKDAFIATEAPLPSRKYMFWQMVVQKHSRIIVVMSDLEEEDVFWPTEGQVEVYRDLEVQSRGESVSDGIITVSMKITHFESNQVAGTVDVTLLVLTDTDGGVARSSPQPSAPALLQLYSAYMRAAAPLGNLPAVVVCRSGVSGCGLFLTVCFELEHLSQEQELDVMTAVSVVRRSRPQFITGQDQFELCYDVAVSWLEAFATYANFQ